MVSLGSVREASRFHEAYVVVAKAIVIPAAHSVDETGRVKVTDELGELLLDRGVIRLSPALVVNDLSSR